MGKMRRTLAWKLLLTSLRELGNDSIFKRPQFAKVLKAIGLELQEWLTALDASSIISTIKHVNQSTLMFEDLMTAVGGLDDVTLTRVVDKIKHKSNFIPIVPLNRVTPEIKKVYLTCFNSEWFWKSYSPPTNLRSRMAASFYVFMLSLDPDLILNHYPREICTCEDELRRKKKILEKNYRDKSARHWSVIQFLINYKSDDCFRHGALRLFHETPTYWGGHYYVSHITANALAALSDTSTSRIVRNVIMASVRRRSVNTLDHLLQTPEEYKPLIKVCDRYGYILLR